MKTVEQILTDNQILNRATNNEQSTIHLQIGEEKYNRIIQAMRIHTHNALIEFRKECAEKACIDTYRGHPEVDTFSILNLELNKYLL